MEQHLIGPNDRPPTGIPTARRLPADRDSQPCTADRPPRDSYGFLPPADRDSYRPPTARRPGFLWIPTARRPGFLPPADRPPTWVPMDSYRPPTGIPTARRLPADWDSYGFLPPADRPSGTLIQFCFTVTPVSRETIKRNTYFEIRQKQNEI